MKRSIVQHGPSTMTVSLPAGWIRNFALKKGDEVTIEPMRDGLFITAGKEKYYGRKRINVKGMPAIIPKAVAALYKCGYDEIVVEYGGNDELGLIHECVNNYIGFEIIDEKKGEVWIRKVSEPSSDEFKTLFRRMFHFLLSTSEEGLEAARAGDRETYQKLILRDASINKLADFCRRVVNKQGQNVYQQDTSLYHVIEQLEKIADDYKDINRILLKHRKPSRKTLDVYRLVHELLKAYEDLFFTFSLQKLNAFFAQYFEIAKIPETAATDQDADVQYLLQNIARELYNLSGTTMILNL